ncbi:MAG: right-handed parallel beta-helix repeat-containing protein [Planctomycetota bacterium]|nr:right-handed parallel beta-helix repeat-containing protein [Planctomycetota bacterium]
MSTLRRTTFRLLLASQVLLGISALSGSVALASDWYVDNLNGDDLWGGTEAEVGAPNGPTRTIAKVLRMAQNGDRIVLMNNEGQPYRESISLVGSRHSGTETFPFIVEGNGATLAGTVAVPDQWEPVKGDLFRIRMQKLQFQQLFLNRKPAKQLESDSRSTTPANLQPLQWLLRDGYMYFRVEPSKLPHEYLPTYAELSTGITLYKVQHVIIRDLTIEGFQIDGIQVHDAGPVLLDGLVARGNGRSGIAVVGASRATIDACLLGDNGRSQILVQIPARATVENSDVINQGAPQWLNEGGKLSVDGKLVPTTAK